MAHANRIHKMFRNTQLCIGHRGVEHYGVLDRAESDAKVCQTVQILSLRCGHRDVEHNGVLDSAESGFKGCLTAKSDFKLC